MLFRKKVDRCCGLCIHSTIVDEDTVRCSKKGNRLDAGIALAHLFVANEETFRFFKAENVTEVTGYTYIGSCTF